MVNIRHLFRAHEISNPTNFVHVGVQNLEADLAKTQKFIFDLAGEEIIYMIETHESHERGRIIIGFRQLDNEIIVSVGDNGCGMSEQTQNELFEPFYTTKAVGEGTGLGIAISFGIVDEHGGHILVKSKLGQGTEIKVHLPLEQAS